MRKLAYLYSIPTGLKHKFQQPFTIFFQIWGLEQPHQSNFWKCGIVIAEQ